MEVFNFMTQGQINKVSEQLGELQEMLEKVEKKTAELSGLKPSKDKPIVKLNYTLDERRFDYAAIKQAEELQRTAIKRPKISSDPNWIAANLEEPDILELYSPQECEKPFSPSLAPAEQSLAEIGEDCSEAYFLLMQSHADRVLDL